MIDDHHAAALKDVVYKSPGSIDKLLSQELMQLSLKERTVLEEEIHGVSTLAAAETPQLLEASLFEFSRALLQIPDDDPIKAVYLQCHVLPESYVHTPDFRLRFLRCEMFDAPKAARRMVHFLDLSFLLFGPIVLERPFRMADFTTEERNFMQTFQILPYRDQRGRQIVAWVGKFELKLENLMMRLRMVLYIRYCLSDDVETQQRGCVNVFCVGFNPVSPSTQWEWEQFEYAKKMNESSPIRHCAVHWCLPTEMPFFHPIQILRCAHTLSLGREQTRVKFHAGERVELLYKLKSYGIPIEYIPVTETGTVKTHYLKQWIRGRDRLEKARELGSFDEFSLVLCPRSKDVLLRGGTAPKSHPGNVMFENIIEARLQEHRSAPQREKEAIIRSIIHQVYDTGGRFLQWDKGGWWSELGDASVIHSKVAVKMRRAKGNAVNVPLAVESSTFAFSNQGHGKRRKVSSSSSGNTSDTSDSSTDGCFSCF